MARFLKSPTQQFVQMGNPVDVEFYSNLLNKAQQDLERGTAIKAAAIEKYGDLEFSSKEDMDAVIGRVQDLLKGATDADFVSPSKVTNAVLQANREVMPGVQAVKAKAKAADMYDRMRVQYGPNFWGGTDPRTQSILDQSTGKYVDPNQFKAVGIDASEVDKAFLASQLSTLTKPGELTWTRQGAPAGKLLIRQTTGLSDAEKEDMYSPGKPTALALAQQQLKTMPQLLEVFNGDTDKALQQIMARNYQTAGAYKQDIQSNLVADEAWLNPLEQAHLKKLNTPDVTDNRLLFTPTENPGIPPTTSSTINDFREARDLYLKVKKNQGKLEMFVDNKDASGRSQGSQFRNVVTGLGYRPDVQGVSNALGDYKLRNESPELYNSYIETAILLNPSLATQVYKNKDGVYEMKNAAVRSLFAKTLNDANNSEDLQIDKVTSKYGASYRKFKEEYADMFGELKKKGMSSDAAMDRIMEWESRVPITNSYDLNNPDVAQKLHTNLVSSTGSKRNIFEVDPETQEYSDKAQNARDVLTKDNAGTIINAKANPSKGSIELTYATDKGYKTYAIVADKGGMDNVSKEAMKTLQDFNDAIFTAKSPETIVYNPYEVDPQTGGYIGYRVIRDLQSGGNQIYEVRVKEGKPFMQSQYPVTQADVLNRYLTQVFTSTTTENKPLKPEL